VPGNKVSKLNTMSSPTTGIAQTSARCSTATSMGQTNTRSSPAPVSGQTDTSSSQATAMSKTTIRGSLALDKCKAVTGCSLPSDMCKTATRGSLASGMDKTDAKGSPASASTDQKPEEDPSAAEPAPEDSQGTGVKPDILQAGGQPAKRPKMTPSHCPPVAETARTPTAYAGAKPACEQEHGAASVQHHHVHLPGSAQQAGRSSKKLFPMFYKTQADSTTRSQERKPRLSALISRFESDDPSPVKMPRPPLKTSLHLPSGRDLLPNCKITKPTPSLSPRWKAPQPTVDSQPGAVSSAVIGLHKKCAGRERKH
jgi:hypothetical protein